MGWLFDADRRGYLLLHSRWRTSRMDPFMVWVTKAGTKGAVWLGICAGLLVAGSMHARWAAILCVAALLAAEGVVNLLLKPAIRRERPFANRALRRLGRLLVEAPGPNSWPSAHAGSSVAAGIVLAYAYPLWSPAFLALALLISYSRIYVGVHYPLDVAAGMCVGLAAAGAVLAAGTTFRPL